ncbi:hypothetical protein TNCV_1505861 [Trichonephila clavipes]|nr:hypothetical protein TNCV_1505861 [Trichonephila clavipes]
MDWPARSPDLNPIDHVWDFLGRRLAARTLPPVTIRELRLALQDEWAANSLTPSFSAWADARYILQRTIDKYSACVEVGKPIDENPACVEVGTNSV